MLYYVLSSLVNAVASTVLGFFVYSINRKNSLNRAFSWFCFAVAIWSWAYCFWPISTDRESILFWFRVLHIGAILIPVAYLHFVLTFAGLKKKKRVFLAVNYCLSLFFLAFDFSPFFIAGMEPKFSFAFWAVPGVLYHFFLLWFFGLSLYCWRLLFKAARRGEELKRVQARYILAGTLVGFLGGSTNYFLWYDIPVPPYGNGLVVFYIILTAIAVIRYHLFEVRLILTEMMVGTMGIILAILPFLMPTAGLKILTAISFFLFCVFGYYLVRATQEESKRREEAEIIAYEERALREQAESLAADLKRLDETKTQFMLSTQHHLRSPLTVVQGYLSMINEEAYGKVNAKVKEKIRASLDANQKMIKIVNDFLDVAKYQMGKGGALKEESDFVQMLREIVADLYGEAETKKIFLKFEEPEKPLPKIMADYQRLKEAFYNIIDNAIKYTQAGGVTVRITADDGKLLITISDTGIGMEASEKEGLFQRTFERGKKAKEVHVTGKGIGLYLAAQMIMSHKGMIRVESEGRDKGTSFHIELPIELPERKDIANNGINDNNESARTN